MVLLGCNLIRAYETYVNVGFIQGGRVAADDEWQRGGSGAGVRRGG
jgi:hypothetical protein